MRSVTPKEDPDDDIVESLGRVVHIMKTVVENVPETSEVRVGLHSYLGGILRGHADILYSFALTRTLLGELRRWRTTYGTAILIKSCDMR